MRTNSILKIAAAALMATSMLAGCGVAQKPVSLCEAGKSVVMEQYSKFLNNTANREVQFDAQFTMTNIVTIDQNGSAVVCRADATFRDWWKGWDAIRLYEGHVAYTVKQTPEGPLYIRTQWDEIGMGGGSPLGGMTQTGTLPAPQAAQDQAIQEKYKAIREQYAKDHNLPPKAQGPVSPEDYRALNDQRVPHSVNEILGIHPQ